LEKRCRYALPARTVTKSPVSHNSWLVCLDRVLSFATRLIVRMLNIEFAQVFRYIRRSPFGLFPARVWRPIYSIEVYSVSTVTPLRYRSKWKWLQWLLTMMLQSCCFEGLFYQGIEESGSDGNLWTINWPGQEPENYIYQVAENANCTTIDTTEMVDCLKALSARDLRRADSIRCTVSLPCTTCYSRPDPSDWNVHLKAFFINTLLKQRTR